MSDKPEQEWSWGEIRFKQRGGEEQFAAWPVPATAGGGDRLLPWDLPSAGEAAQGPALRFRTSEGVPFKVVPLPFRMPVAAHVEWSAGGVVAKQHLRIDLGQGGAHRFVAAATDEKGRLTLAAADATALLRRTSALISLSAQPRDAASCTAGECQQATFMRREHSPGLVVVVCRAVAVTVPLAVKFASLTDAQAWLARGPIDVTVDGDPAAGGAQVVSPSLIEVHCEVPPGAHDVVVSARHRGLGGSAPRRIVYLARRCQIPEGGPHGLTVLDR